VAEVRDDAESHQCIRLLLDDIEGFLNRALEDVDRLDDVIGGDDREDRFGIALLQHRGGKADGIGRVAANRFAEQVFGRKFGEIRRDLGAM